MCARVCVVGKKDLHLPITAHYFENITLSISPLSLYAKFF